MMNMNMHAGVWSKFDIRSLGEYHDLYLKYDVLLLADIFEYFRDHCMKCYNLDQSHYFSLPGFSWNACLRYNKVELELITNIDQYLLVEKGIRGGISVVSNRASTANNKYLHKFIIALDVNSLYGFAMTQPLPTGNFNLFITGILPEPSVRSYR